MGVDKVRVARARAAPLSRRRRLGGILAAAVLVGGLSAGVGPAMGQTNTNVNDNTSENTNSNQSSNANNNTIVNTITNVNDITNTNVNGSVDLDDELVEVLDPAQVAVARQTGTLVVTG